MFTHRHFATPTKKDTKNEIPKLEEKKKRGRPPKVKVETDTTTEVKKKRGRPPKSLKSVEQEQKAKIESKSPVETKKKRGRPPKVKEVKEEGASVQSTIWANKNSEKVDDSGLPIV